MIGKVKQWLGIEGVKLKLVVPDEINKNAGIIQGHIRFESKHAQKVQYISIYLVERYSRGKKAKKRIDEYVLGELEINRAIEVQADEAIEIPFSLPFDLLKSNMDKFQEQNFLTKGMVGLAKWLKSVKSEYRIEAEAKVMGTALDPFDRKVLKLK